MSLAKVCSLSCSTLSVAWLVQLYHLFIFTQARSLGGGGGSYSVEPEAVIISSGLRESGL